MPNGWEWAILVLIALLLLGGARLSGISRDVGRGAGEFTDELAADSSEATVAHSPASPEPVEEASPDASAAVASQEAPGENPAPNSPPAAAEND